MTSSPPPQTNNVHQIFQGPVENVAGRDVNITNELGGRPLTKRERSALNAQVERLIKDFGQERWEPWQFLHETIGVNEIGEMRLEHLKPAQTVLELMLERAELARQVSRAQADKVQLCTLEVEFSRLKSLVIHERSLNERNTYELAQYRQQLDRACQQRDIATQEHTKLQNLVALQKSEQAQQATPPRNSWSWKVAISWMIGALLAGVGVFVYQPAFQADLHAEQNKAVMLKRKDICLFDGKPFSWGTRLPTSTGVQKCVQSRTGQYLWQPDK